MSRVLILDPNCRYLRGHHFPVCESLTQMLAGHAVSVVIHAKAGPEIAFDPSVEILRWPQDRTLTERLFRVPPTKAAAAARDAKDVRTMSAFIKHAGLGAGDAIIIHTATGMRVRALCTAQSALPAKMRPTAHIRFLWIDRAKDGSFDVAGMRALDDMIRKLGGVHLYSENIEMAAHLEQEYFTQPVWPWLIPLATASEFPAAVRGDPDDEFVVGFLGSMRREQGLQRVPQIIQAYARLNDGTGQRKTRFLVRTAAPPRGLRRLSRTNGKLSPSLDDDFGHANIHVEKIVGDLDNAAYASAIARCHVLVMPYDGDKYWLRSSGLVIDGALTATPVIVSQGVAMGDWLQTMDAPVVQSIDEFAQSIMDVAQDYNHYASKAAEAQTAIKSRMEWSLKHYLNLPEPL